MGEEKKVKQDVETQYCNGDHCQYDCTTPVANICNAVTSGKH